MKKTARSSLLTLGILLLGAAVGAHGRPLQLAIVSSVTSLDPIGQDNLTATSVILQMYEGLFGYGKMGNVEPRLAASWNVSPDRRTYTFTLKNGVRFSNGKSLVAEDIKNSLERVAHAKSLNAWALDPIAAITSAPKPPARPASSRAAAAAWSAAAPASPAARRGVVWWWSEVITSVMPGEFFPPVPFI